MFDGFEKSINNILLIKNILSRISVLDNFDNDTNLNDLLASSKHDDFVNFIDRTQDDIMEDKSRDITKLKVINKNISSTNSSSNFSNLLDNNWPSSFSQESIYNDNYNDLYQEDEWDGFLDEQKERQLKMMAVKNKSFEENKISENEMKVTSHPMVNSVKNASFITRCIKQRPMVCYDFSCKTRNPSSKRVELLTPVKEKKWFEDYKMELQFLKENFSEVLPEILYDVVRKRVTDPVHYIVHHLIKYKVDKVNNEEMYKYLNGYQL